MSNSKLVTYTKISPNKTVNRNHKIDTITIHHMAGNCSIEACGEIFANKRTQASSNYGIGSDGRIAMYVEEKDRSWCSSSPSNDHRAITIEVANIGSAAQGWPISKKAYRSLIKLLVDICERNDIPKLLWKNNKKLIGKVSKQNMTVHCWFKDKVCPGPYLMKHMKKIAKEVNAELKANKAKKRTTKKTVTKKAVE